MSKLDVSGVKTNHLSPNFIQDLPVAPSAYSLSTAAPINIIITWNFVDYKIVEKQNKSYIYTYIHPTTNITKQG